MHLHLIYMEKIIPSNLSAVPPRLSLELSAGPWAGTELSIPLKSFSLPVGRTKASKVHIKDSAVSEKHATIGWDGEHWTVRQGGEGMG